MVATISYDTIYGHQQGVWMKGDRGGAALKGKFVNEQAAYVYRDRSYALAEQGSPSLATAEQTSFIKGLFVGIIGSLVADYLYDQSKRRR